jgi:serine/threonine protein kinase
MLFGVCPFEERSIANLVSLIDNKSLHLPLNVNPISESTQTLLRKMLVVDASKRISPADLISYRLNRIV